MPRIGRARDLGIAPGMYQPGPRNAITDVAGLRVGHATVRLGDSVRTGVTAVLPHGGNLFLDRVPAAIHVGNRFGKLLGSTQVHELGELGNDEMSPLFTAVTEATEEAVYNSLFMATTVTGNGNSVEAIPLADVRRLLKPALKRP